ncbi:acetyl-CoA carboxylase biotin carboxyl carrier protein subunit [Gillisia marina]|uniref:acetyl-CoA carboxylase biotin carboxyl carrier protein subunit n=1 Tax=Gillisia marina TaxID=1167637 RepID=UPI00029A56B9|nr:acetyl-CoA carboxylase biotin carboxyl carrier protein subunit [Gillisia marina]
MDKKYKVKVNDSYEHRFTNDEILSLDTQSLSNSKFHVLQKEKSFSAEILEADFLRKNYTVKINSNTYRINISNELDLKIEDMGLSINTAKQVNDIKAPMPGLILDVLVSQGSEVKEGDYLVVLEAMKMENTLTAPRDGIVKSISVSKGDAVDKNQLLIEME